MSSASAPPISTPKARRKNGGPSAFAMLLRTLAALLGGYGIASLWCALTARALPLAPSEAVTVASLSAFIVYVAFALWCFAARTTLKVWLVLTLLAALLGGGLWLSYILAPAP